MLSNEDILHEISELERELDKMRPSITVTDYSDATDYTQELMGLTGLESVKSSLAEFINNYRIQAERQRLHPDLNQQLSFNSIFKGRPGTGKTTVARLVAGILRQQGILPGGQCVEVDATTLISGWVGASAKAAKLAALKAIGGVLFIDEAYTLAGGKGSSGDAGKEVIDSLTPILENNRDSLVVIMAGYNKEMDDFLTNVNTGFASRFRQTVFFEDYNADDMLTIFYSMMIKNHYVMSEAADRVAHGIFDYLYRNRNHAPGFANARTVRNIFETVCSRASARMARSGTTDYDLILAEDVMLSPQEVRASVGLL